MTMMINDAHAAFEQEAAEDKADGFWLYLMSDAIIFCLLFATYFVLYRNLAGGPDGHTLFSLKNAAIETALLLLSSVAFGFATVNVGLKQKNMVLLFLIVALLLGFGFLFMELSEFHEMIAHGAGPQRSAFLSSFFTLVGTHGLHVSIGSIWLIVMLVQVSVKGLTTPIVSRLSRLGVFWHFLDLVWIGIFSIVYLPSIL